MNLPKYSNEQFDIINKIINNNIIVNSVAGSGKTTTNLHIAKYFTDLKILLLTYNSKLKIETREKTIKYDINNLDVHSYHSYCVKYYDQTCFTDSQIIRLLKTINLQNMINPYDIIIVDEAQDMNPIYFELFCKIYKDNNNKNCKICILGDKKQSIYDFNKADERFIIYADSIFKLNEFAWVRCNLSKSFRITFEMSEFINNCMFNYNRIISDKVSNNKPRYLICDTFGIEPFNELKYYLDNGYKPDDIFIIAPSIKNPNCPVRKLENRIKTLLLNVNIYIPISDEESLDNDIIENKLVFSTIHQVKGLERKVVILFNFDDSYFTYYKKNASKDICPNELYVATTRGLEHLSLLHHYQNNYLQFLNKDEIEKHCIVKKKKLYILEKKNNNNVINESVINIIKHLPCVVIDECFKYFDIIKVRDIGKKINIPVKINLDHGSEEVSDINGIAIPSYFEYKLKGKMSILDEIRCNDRSNNDNANANEIIMNKVCMFNDMAEKARKYDINNINLENLQEDELLYIANKWSSFKTGFLFKLYQINTYNWLTKKKLNSAMKRLDSLNISKTANFELNVKISDRKELLNRKLVGYIDCADIDNNNIYEFKCVKEINKEYFLQLVLYMYIHEYNKEENILLIKKDDINKKLSMIMIKENDAKQSLDKYINNQNEINDLNEQIINNNKNIIKMYNNIDLIEGDIIKFMYDNHYYEGKIKLISNLFMRNNAYLYIDNSDIKFLLPKIKNIEFVYLNNEKMRFKQFFKNDKCNDLYKECYKNNIQLTKQLEIIKVNQLPNDIEKIYNDIYDERKKYENELIKYENMLNNISISNTNYYLYNILTDELISIKSDIYRLIKMVEYLFYNKYVNYVSVSDDEFIVNMNKILNKQIIK